MRRYKAYQAEGEAFLLHFAKLIPADIARRCFIDLRGEIKVTLGNYIVFALRSAYLEFLQDSKSPFDFCKEQFTYKPIGEARTYSFRDPARIATVIHDASVADSFARGCEKLFDYPQGKRYGTTSGMESKIPLNDFLSNWAGNPNSATVLTPQV
jgi:hypothetical protein